MTRPLRRARSQSPWLSGVIGRALLAASFVLAVGNAAQAADTYYVATNGDDSRTKAQATNSATPWKTLNASIAKLAAGDTLLARGGRYVEWLTVRVSGTAAARITIAAYAGESPIIDGNATLPTVNWAGLVNITGDYVTFSGFEVRNSILSNNARGISIIGRYDVVARCNVHHVLGNGILISGRNGTVEDSVVWQTDQDNAMNPGSGWGSALTAARGTTADDPFTYDAIIRRNVVFNNWGEGLSTYEAQGTLIEDNIIYDNYAQNIYISDARDVMFRRNIIYKTPGNAVGPNTNCALADERSFVPRSSGNTVINNLFYNIDLSAFDWTLVPGSGLTNALIANNTFVNGRLMLGTVNSGSRIMNNIFTSGAQVKSAAGLTWSNNLWQGTRPANAVGTGDVFGDPLLAKAGLTGPGQLTAGYFKIASSSSPAIGAAVTLSEVTEDYFKAARGVKRDIGAHEFVANRAPTASVQSVTTPSNTAKAITLGGSDTDGEVLTFSIVGNPAHGSLSGSGAARTYTPASNYVGADSFTFKVNDGTVDSATAMVSITVSGSGTNQAPSVTAATATPNSVTGTTTALSATATDDAGEGGLIYTWSASPPTATFSPNGTNAAKASTATFTAAGTYTVVVTARDAGGLTATRSVSVTVAQAPKTLAIAPATANVVVSTSKALTVSVKDQFNRSIAAPSVTWSIVSGGGSVSSSGVFSAPATTGSTTVRASAGSATATAVLTTVASGSGGDEGAGGGSGGGHSCGAGGGLATLLLLCLGACFMRESTALKKRD